MTSTAFASARISKLLHGAVSSILRTTPFEPILNRRVGSGTILMYHSISDGPSNTPNSILRVSPQNFDSQMCYLKKNADVVSLSEIIQALQHGRKAERLVAITFDDGYRDNLTSALPILERYDLPATIFLTTDYLDETSFPWWEALESILINSKDSSPIDTFYKLAEEFKPAIFNQQTKLLNDLVRLNNVDGYSTPPMLSWSEAKLLANHPLITIGAHTVSHPSLSNLESAECRRELSQSKEILEAKLGKPIEFLAYPYGTKIDAGEREFSIAAEVQYRAAVTTEPAHLKPRDSGNRFALPRLSVDGRISLYQFKNLVSGVQSLLAAP